MAGEQEQRELVDDLLPEVEDGEQSPETFDAEDDPAGDEPDAGDEVGDEGDAPPDETPEQKAQRIQKRDAKTGKFKPGKTTVKQPTGKPGQQQPPANQQQPPQQQPPQQSQTVPLAVLLQERNESKAELARLRAEIEALKNPPKQPEAPPPIPDHAADPKGYVDGTVAAALKKLEEANKAATEQAQAATRTAQQSAEQAQEVQFGQLLERAETVFVQQNPDYYDALAHVRGIRVEQLKLVHPGITEDQIRQQIGREELQLARQVAQQNRNPIEFVYELAKRFGYQRQQPLPGQQGQQQQGQQQNGLPPVEGGPRQLPPDQRLGTASGGQGGGKNEDADPGQADGYKDPFDDAFSEMFSRGRKRA